MRMDMRKHLVIISAVLFFFVSLALALHHDDAPFQTVTCSICKVKNSSSREQDWPGEVEQLTGDRNTGTLDALKNRAWDVCIDNPTTLPFWVRDAGQVLKGKVGQYVFISTLSVYAEEKEVGADETAPVAQYQGGRPDEGVPGDAARRRRQPVRPAEGPVGEGSRAVVPGHHDRHPPHAHRRTR